MEANITVCPSCGSNNRLRTSPSEQIPICGKCKSPLPWLTVAGDATFAAEIESPVPVLVDFWAEWCGPCRMVTPILEELAHELAGRLKVVKLNVDQNPVTAQQFRVMSIPTLILFKGGIMIDQIVGALPKAALLNRLQAHLPH